MITRGKGSERNTKGGKKSESCHPAGSLAPYGPGRGHLGTHHKGRVSRGRENGSVSELLGAKGALPVCVYISMCVYKNPAKHDT